MKNFRLELKTRVDKLQKLPQLYRTSSKTKRKNTNHSANVTVETQEGVKISYSKLYKL